MKRLIFHVRGPGESLLFRWRRLAYSMLLPMAAAALVLGYPSRLLHKVASVQVGSVVPARFGVSGGDFQIRLVPLKTDGEFSSALDAGKLSGLFAAAATFARKGGLIVSARATFDPPLPASGYYRISGPVAAGSATDELELQAGWRYRITRTNHDPALDH